MKLTNPSVSATVHARTHAIMCTFPYSGAPALQRPGTGRTTARYWPYNGASGPYKVCLGLLKWCLGPGPSPVKAALATHTRPACRRHTPPLGSPGQWWRKARLRVHPALPPLQVAGCRGGSCPLITRSHTHTHSPPSPLHLQPQSKYRNPGVSEDGGKVDNRKTSEESRPAWPALAGRARRAVHQSETL